MPGLSCGTAPVMQVNNGDYHESLDVRARSRRCSSASRRLIATTRRESMGIDVAIACAKAVVILLIALQVMAHGRVLRAQGERAHPGPHRREPRRRSSASPGHGLINTLVADPLKFLPKEDVRPAGRRPPAAHAGARAWRSFPPSSTFAVMPFGDVLEIGDRTINLQAASLDVGILYVLAMASLGVYGVVLGGWASNNRWSLLGGIRGSAQMISYEIAMGLALVGVVLTYGTLDLQEMARAQGELDLGLAPGLGHLLPAARRSSSSSSPASPSRKRIPFDLPESESELVSGYFTEYSGAKHLMFMMSDFVEVVLVAGARHHALLRRLADPVPRARRLPLPVGQPHRAAVARRGRAPGRCRSR